MHRIITNIIFLSIFALTGCTYTSTSVFSVHTDVKSVEQSTNHITSTLGMIEKKNEDSSLAYVYDKGSITRSTLKPTMQPQNDSLTKVTLITTSAFQEVSDNLGLTVTSFYKQSLDSNYAQENPDKLFRLEQKSVSEFYRKNWISPALALNYVGTNNPFVDQADNRSGTIVAGLFDAFCLTATIGGPFIGKTSNDKISISLTGIVGLLGWRILFPVFGDKQDLEEYNRIVGSKYSLPKELIKE